MEIEKLQYIFDLEMEHLELEIALKDAEENYRQAQYDSREAKRTALEYEGFSLGAIWDRLGGRYEKRLEQNRRALRVSEGTLFQARQELERLRGKQRENQEQRKAQPSWDIVREQIQEEASEYLQYAELEMKLCRARLLILLEQTRTGLLESRSVLRGDVPGRILGPYEQQQLLAAPNEPAQECGKWLERMKTAAEILKISFEIPAYFQEPVAYLAAATKFTQFDRYAEALKQTEKLINELQSSTQDN